MPVKTEVGNGSHGIFFLFKGQPVFVKKYLYFREGTFPLEQQLLIKYGELAKKRELQEGPGPVDYRSAARQIRQAGVELVVGHEIDYAVKWKSRFPKAGELVLNAEIGAMRFYRSIGLGLSICYSIMKQLGGHITVRSEFGKGTEFTLFIPEKPPRQLREDMAHANEGQLAAMPI